ncbi:MAG: AAA family ATPase, partial [Actinobacteria bacterium]|nr:AAA family ATPase [Actinomycetota bacterium]
MRLHRLRLRHVKGVTELSLDFPDTGVVVVEGPNEVGKSTLLEALDRLLDPSCKATSKSAGVKAMQPVGVEAAPFVEAELSLGGYRLVFAKQWLLRPTTTLRVLAPRPEQLAGEAAQARMTAILSECLDRPLFDALRFTQAGEPQIPLTSSRLLAEALDGAAGADLHTDTGADLLGEVEGEFLRYFTRTGRPTGELRAAITETETARDAAVHAHTRVGEAQDLLEQRESAVATLRAAELGTPE